MSTIIYGGDTLETGIQIAFVDTRSIDFVPVTSADDMDVQYTRITFDVAGVVSAPLPPALVGENATQTLARMEHYLNQKRKAFQYSVNGQPLVTWLGGPDCRNGPHPAGVRVNKVHGSETYHIQFKIELNIVTCPNDQRQPWVSHRWTEEVTIDETARTKKARHGRIVTRGDSMLVSPDALRGLVMPPIDQGFLREESRYTIQSDGLALDYSYRDHEQFLMPPVPAWKCSGDYIESTPTLAQRWGEARVTLRGSKGTDKSALMRLAITVAWSKLRSEVLIGDKGAMIVFVGGLKENLYEPEVSVSIKARLKGLTLRTSGVPIDLTRFSVFPFGSDPNLDRLDPPDPGTRGTAGLNLIAAALNDPCLAQTVLRTAGAQPSGPSVLQGQGAPQLAQVTMTRQLPDDTSALYADPDPGIYTNYRVSMHTHQDLNQIQMPVGKEGAPPVIMRTAAPTQTRLVKWEAEKVGGPPKLPDPDLGDNFPLANAVITTDEVVPEADGVSLKYTVAGEYTYHVRDFTQAVLYSGVPPWVGDSAKPDALRSVSQFAKGIIDLGLAGYGAVFNAAGGMAVKLTNLPDLENK